MNADRGSRWPHLADRQDIIRWADRIEARSEFPRLIRSLVRQTNDQVVELEMRAAEGTGVPGYDVYSKASRGTPFVPDGEAVWELGTGVDPQDKANDDYNSRTANPLGQDRATTTFVFVTPREWRGKQAWSDAKRGEGVWADVRTLDVDDIEAALEAAPAAHVWFSEVVGKPGQGAQTVDDWWARFIGLTSPALDPELVLAGRADEAAQLLQLLEEESRLTTVAAASIDDVLAFVAATIMSTPEDLRADLLDRALIVRDAFTLRRLDLSEGLLILLPFEEELRREAQLIRAHHVVFLAADGAEPNITLPSIDIQRFEQLLRERDEGQERAQELARAARRSIVAFQRRGAFPMAGLTPPWAQAMTSRVSRRAWLAGRWNERRSGDLDALAIFFESAYNDAREELVKLSSGADPLLVRVGDTWAVASPPDAWQFGKASIQSTDLAAFEVLIQTVLGAVDPRLEIPVAERWRAAIYGKSRLHSSDLRQGIAEVLALLGARGDQVSVGASETIRSWLHGALWRLFERLNADATGQLWASLTDVLPLLAEGAPDVFLQAVQKGLEGDRPLLGVMFADLEGDAFSVSSPHTGLLWALEGVAWSPEHFGLTVEQLARLAEVDPGGRLSNRPAGSLADIFRPWLPQTSVSAERRLAVLDTLRERHGDIAWTLMLTMLPEFHAVGNYTHSPKYRDWKPEGQDTVPRDRASVFRAVAGRLVEDARTDPQRWVALVERLDDFPAEEFRQAASRLETLATSPDGSDLRQQVWEPLRDLVQKHRRYSYTEWAMPPEHTDLLDSLQERLAPDDPVAVVRWLFDEQMPDLPEQNSGDFDASVYREAVAIRRRTAVVDLANTQGVDAVLRLAREAEHPWFVGWAVGEAALDDAGRALLTAIDDEDRKLVNAAEGWARQRASSLGWDWVQKAVSSIHDRPIAKARVLLASDELESVWAVAAQDAAVDAAYWAEFIPYGRGPNFALAQQASEQLLLHERPKAALMLMNLYATDVQVDPDLVMRGLERLVELPEDHPDQFRVDSHEIEQLLDYVRASVTDEERLGLLEWRLRPALRFDAESPILERRLSRDPAFFVEVLSLCFKPRNREPEQEVPSHVATNAYQLLHDWRIVPGTAVGATAADRESLAAWIQEARRHAEAADRAEIADVYIGQILAHATSDDDGTWPTVAVRDALESGTDEMRSGFRTQVYNNRGVVSRSPTEGGTAEYELARRYEDWASKIADRWPNTAATLRSLAEGYDAEGRRNDQEAERAREGIDRWS